MCVQPAAAQVGPYVILETLGMGASGKVKLGRHIKTGELVALKFVRNNLLSSNSALYDKLRREMAVLKFIAATHRQLQRASRTPDVQSMGVLNLLDVFDYGQSTVLVLEYCPRGELFDLLSSEGCLASDVVLDYTQQLVHALAFCHRRGICHRDLKLENILVSQSGALKIADFGMASLTFPGSFLRTSCGSPQYCAPEVILGESYNGAIADIWSLGIILYAMTTGGLPFDDDNFQRLVMKIQSGAFYMPSEVPQPIAQLITRMLDPDASTRITLDEIKESEWFNSSPCRSDVYVEPINDQQSDENNSAACNHNKNVGIAHPDDEVVRQLVDLGLGDVNVIKLRLRGEKPCKEKDYYYVLFDFCSFIKSQHKQPQQHMNVPSKQQLSIPLQVTTDDVATLCSEQQADANDATAAVAALNINSDRAIELAPNSSLLNSDQVYHNESIPVGVSYSVYAG